MPEFAELSSEEADEETEASGVLVLVTGTKEETMEGATLSEDAVVETSGSEDVCKTGADDVVSECVALDSTIPDSAPLELKIDDWDGMTAVG